MLKFNASAFYDCISALDRGRTLIEERKDRGKNVLVPLDRINAKEYLKLLSNSLKVLGAKVTDVGVMQLIARFEVKGKKNALIYEELVKKTTLISDTLKNELSLINVFVLENAKSEYFQNPELQFGTDFQKRFPSGLFELDEAAKCFALGRPTACIFHLMRIMEIGINAAALSLGIPPPTKGMDRNWGAILRAIKEETEKRTSAKPSKWQGDDKDLFAEIYVSLDAVRVAWRNTTMHVENKYTDEEAEHIFGAVRGFMKKIAARFDETGIPLA